MKINTTLLVTIAAVLLAVSCHKIDNIQRPAGEEVTVNYSVAVADATKALNDGADAN